MNFFMVLFDFALTSYIEINCLMKLLIQFIYLFFFQFS